jgi:CBS domain-containing protein
MPTDPSQVGRSHHPVRTPPWNAVPPEWLWRAGALVGLVLGLTFAVVALLWSIWWGLPGFLALAATVVCLYKSEPVETAGPPARPRPVDRVAAEPPPAPARPSRRARSTLRVQDVMTPNPTAMQADAPVTAAARAMRDLDIGAVVVVEDDRPLGIVTDRDIVVRALARSTGGGPATIGDVCSRPLATVPADASVEDALDVMAENAVRRLPVTVSRSVVGIVSIEDLVDVGGSVPALRQIRDAPSNR